ncbi:hypothetical protein H2248_005612 [Termitomyces sp. 'cryptogamus']|nr:hypothetical protein H2248_005612 [Termitomyces sp. 'cryptogamus']
MYGISFSKEKILSGTRLNLLATELKIDVVAESIEEVKKAESEDEKDSMSEKLEEESDEDE